MMIRPLFEAIDKNMKKKVKSLSDDQWIEVLECSLEMMHLNEELAKKIILRDMIRNKINGGTVSDKFKDVDQELEILIPKLVCVLQREFAEQEFVKNLMLFNSTKTECKV
jgi:uncharacterized protein YaiL (DUF2058 family)